jgi:hypothetical protein
VHPQVGGVVGTGLGAGGRRVVSHVRVRPFASIG